MIDESTGRPCVFKTGDTQAVWQNNWRYKEDSTFIGNIHGQKNI